MHLQKKTELFHQKALARVCMMKTYLRYIKRLGMRCSAIIQANICWHFSVVIEAGFRFLPALDVSSVMDDESGLCTDFSSIYQVSPNQFVQSETNSGKHSCQYCGKSFYRLQYCTDHINAHHLRTKPHTCSVCGVGFSYKTSLHRHKSLMGHRTSGRKGMRSSSHFGTK